MATHQKRKQGDLTRKKIFSEAAILFLERGYYATSVNDIIQAADVSKGTFYHHFKSKLDLYRQIIYDFVDVDNHLITFEEFEGLEMQQAFEILISKYYEFAKQLTEQTGRSLAHFQRLFYEAILILPEVADKIRNSYLRVMRIFTQKAQKEFNLTHLEAQKLVIKYMFQFEGIFHWIALFPATDFNDIMNVMKMDEEDKC